MMFRERKDLDIYPLGYEHTIPILCQFRDDPTHKPHKNVIDKIINNFDNTPDYLIAKSDKSEVYIVEVKYKATYIAEEILFIAQEVNDRWNPSWLFIASKDGFYFDSCGDIIKNQGIIKELDWIDKKTQAKFIKILNQYEH